MEYVRFGFVVGRESESEIGFEFQRWDGLGLTKNERNNEEMREEEIYSLICMYIQFLDLERERERERLN